jgi:hypothetical protein
MSRTITLRQRLKWANGYALVTAGGFVKLDAEANMP